MNKIAHIILIMIVLPTIIMGMSSNNDQKRRYKQLAKLIYDHKVGDYIGSNAFFANIKAGKEVEDETLDDTVSNYKIDRCLFSSTNWIGYEYVLINEGIFTTEYLKGFFDFSRTDDHAIKVEVDSLSPIFIGTASQPISTTHIKKINIVGTGVAAIISASYLGPWLIGK